MFKEELDKIIKRAESGEFCLYSLRTLILKYAKWLFDCKYDLPQEVYNRHNSVIDLLGAALQEYHKGNQEAIISNLKKARRLMSK